MQKTCVKSSHQMSKPVKSGPLWLFQLYLGKYGLSSFKAGSSYIHIYIRVCVYNIYFIFYMYM